MKHKYCLSEQPIAKPLVKEVIQRQKADFRRLARIASVGSTPLPPPDLYQDAGGGYNRTFIFPQE